MVVNSTLNILTLLVGLVVTVVVGLASLGYARKTALENAERAEKIGAELSGRADKLITALRGDVGALQDMVRMQENRLFRMEIESQRKTRLLNIARQEIGFFEDVVRVVLSVLTKLSPDEKKRIESALTDLTEFRLRTYREQEEWEATKDALTAYLERHASRPDGLHVPDDASAG